MGRMSPEAADHPANRVLLDHLRARARPGKPADRAFAIDEWELHTHPDLLERLDALTPDGTSVIPLYGVPALVVGGIVAVVALGTDSLMVRLPRLPDGLATEQPLPGLTDHGWQAVSAWQSDLPSAEGTRRLARLIADAVDHARDLGR